MTLIEVMVVVVIMAMIAVAVGINVVKVLNDNKVKATRSRARTIQTATVALLLEEDGGCPSFPDIKQQLDPTTDHTDAWGHDFRLSCEGDVVHVQSPGKDGQFDTEDDIAL